jgi:1-acyl-sn-glycerol-3-phosphate acyltransferase
MGGGALRPAVRRNETPLSPADRTEPPARHTLFNGLVALPGRRQQAYAALGLGFWLGPPLHGARLLGRAGRRRELHTLVRWWARGLRRHLGIELEIDGLHYIDPHEQYVVTPLHEGFADAVALFHLPLALRFAARDELFDWRHFGTVLRDTGQLVVYPEAGAVSYRQLHRQAPAVFASGESLVLFPQGSILGIETDFRAGPFALAAALHRPILPVVLTGSHRVWEHPYTPRLRYGQRISMAVLEPLSAAEVAVLGARNARAEVQRRLKGRALAGDLAAPRRYVPARDGYWDGYAFEIDPDFVELHAEIARHRASQQQAAS